MTNKHQTKSLLITGAAGFIGSNFVHYWITHYPDSRIIALDALTYAGNLENINELKSRSNFKFIHGDILDVQLIEDILNTESIDTIVHFAAESHVDRSILGPDAFIKTNIEGTHCLLKAAKKSWLDKGISNHRFHHVSTDEVYGTLSPDEPAFTESHQYAPNSPYAASKASSDHLVRAYHETYGLNVTTSNCSNNYGPYQFPEKLIPLLIVNCLDGKPLPVYGDGNQIRDWLYVDDHNRGIDKVIHEGSIGEVYNIGGNNEWKNIDIVTLVCKLMDKHHPQGAPHTNLIQHIVDRPGHDRRYAIDARKITQQLKFHPLETFESGIVKTVEWYLNNQSWWRNVMDNSYQDWIKKNY